MKKIYLCGVQHFDLKGPERFRNIIRKISPEIIAIEFDKKGSGELIKDHKKYLKMMKNNKFNFKAISEKINKETAKQLFLSVGYEVWVSEEYARKKRIKILYLEDEDLINKTVKNTLDNLIEEDFIKALELSPKRFQERFDRHYTEIKSKNSDNKDKEFNLIERNKIFTEKIKKLKGRILVLCGMSHINGPEPNLKTLLKEHKPKIITLLNHAKQLS